MNILEDNEDGTFAFTLDPDSRDVVRSLLKQLRDLMSAGDESVARLFPPAFLNDPQRQEDYDALMRNELMAQHLDALNTVEATLDEPELTVEQAEGWIKALNEIRLVLGTNLNVTEEMDLQNLNPDDPSHAPLFVYDGLGWILESFLVALTPTLPPPIDEPGSG